MEFLKQHSSNILAKTLDLSFPPYSLQIYRSFLLTMILIALGSFKLHRVYSSLASPTKLHLDFSFVNSSFFGSVCELCLNYSFCFLCASFSSHPRCLVILDLFISLSLVASCTIIFMSKLGQNFPKILFPKIKDPT